MNRVKDNMKIFDNDTSLNVRDDSNSKARLLTFGDMFIAPQHVQVSVNIYLKSASSLWSVN